MLVKQRPELGGGRWALDTGHWWVPTDHEEPLGVSNWGSLSTKTFLYGFCGVRVDGKNNRYAEIVSIK